MTAIRTEFLSKTYRLGVFRRPLQALKNLNLEVREGEVFAFLGLNGAGKTTTIKLLLDHARPTAGSAYLFGVNARLPSSRRRVGYQPDMPHFHRYLTAGELMDYFGRLSGLSVARRRQSTQSLLNLVGLDGRQNERLKGFSRGMLQRLGLAQALLGDPDLVILDEPLGGLDPMGRAELRDVIAGLKRDGRTVFFSSHILEDAERIADRVGILHRGELLACGTLEELVGRSAGWEVELTPNNRQDLEQLCIERGWRRIANNGYLTIQVGDVNELHTLLAEAVRRRSRVESVHRRRMRLEEAFLAELSRWGK